MPGTSSDASSSWHPRVPVPIAANRTRSLAATARSAPHMEEGSSKVIFATAPAAAEPAPIRMNLRRVKGCILPVLHPEFPPVARPALRAAWHSNFSKDTLGPAKVQAILAMSLLLDNPSLSFLCLTRALVTSGGLLETEK